MRTLKSEQLIRDGYSLPFVVENFLSHEEVDYLKKYFYSSGKRKLKPSGPLTLVLQPHDMEEDAVLSKLLLKAKSYIPEDFEFNSGLFFNVEYPHIIHNDDSNELPQIYKAIMIPLDIEYDSGSDTNKYPKLCFFDQHYLKGPAKFFANGQTDPVALRSAAYNRLIFEYSDVEDKVLGNTIPENIRIEYFPHVKREWLDGLSLYGMLDSKIGNATIFDSVQLHCASDFRKIGVKQKLGISIFTKRKAK